MGAPLGNKNGAKKRLPWQQALKRALTKLAADDGEDKPNYRRGLDRVAKQVVKQAVDGNKEAWQEIANRIEGKPSQALEISGPDGEPLQAQLNYLPICPPDK
jgi:hypothetical protein